MLSKQGWFDLQMSHRPTFFVQEITALMFFKKLQPSFIGTKSFKKQNQFYFTCPHAETFWQTSGSKCQLEKADRKMLGFFVSHGTRNVENVKDGRERTEGGRGGGCLKNAVYITHGNQENNVCTPSAPPSSATTQPAAELHSFNNMVSFSAHFSFSFP